MIYDQNDDEFDDAEPDDASVPADTAVGSPGAPDEPPAVVVPLASQVPPVLVLQPLLRYWWIPRYSDALAILVDWNMPTIGHQIYVRGEVTRTMSGEREHLRGRFESVPKFRSLVPDPRTGLDWWHATDKENDGLVIGRDAGKLGDLLSALVLADDHLPLIAARWEITETPEVRAIMDEWARRSETEQDPC